MESPERVVLNSTGRSEQAVKFLFLRHTRFYFRVARFNYFLLFPVYHVT